jgi:hypothetical protein
MKMKKIWVIKAVDDMGTSYLVDIAGYFLNKIEAELFALHLEENVDGSTEVWYDFDGYNVVELLPNKN